MNSMRSGMHRRDSRPENSLMSIAARFETFYFSNGIYFLRMWDAAILSTKNYVLQLLSRPRNSFVYIKRSIIFDFAIVERWMNVLLLELSATN